MPNPKCITRWSLILGAGILLISQTGCQIFQRFGTRPEPAPIVLDAGLPSQQQLLGTLNAHSNRVQQLQSNISLSFDGMPKLKGTLQLERPDRLRMKAGVMGVSELGIDVGSNSDQFWVWSKASLPGQQPAIYFANQNEFRDMRSRAEIPIEPQWIIDASGLVEFPAHDIHQGPFAGPGGMLKMHSIRQTAAGPVTRVCLIEPKTARIVQQALYDAANNLIAWSNSSNYRYYAENQVSLPQRIELHVIAPNGQAVKLVLDAGEYKINALYGNPDQMWSMPDPEGIPKVNLARQPHHNLTP